MVKKLLQFLLNLLFPKRCPWCGKVQGFNEKCSCFASLEDIVLPNEPLDLVAEGQRAEYLVDAWACFSYTFPVSNAILRVKFEDDTSAISSLGAFLRAKFTACGLKHRFDVVVPVPVSAKTMRTRGYNQSELLARQLAQEGMPVLADALYKDKETPRQMDLGRKERLNNVSGVYKAKLADEIVGKRVLLVDDIITTGSTLNECAKTLLEAGAECCGALCLACTSKDHVYEKKGKDSLLQE